MKKSNDYFEMLKTLSATNTAIVENVLSHTSVSKLKIDFYSSQSELYDRLIDEFLPPLDRSDIYVLSRCLEDEFNALCSFEIITNYKNVTEFREILFKLSSLSNENTAIFSELKNFKNPKKILKAVRENKRGVTSSISSCTKEIYSFSKLSADSVMIEGNKAIISVFKTLYIINTEIERIIINNN